MALKDLEIRRILPKKTPYKVSDEKGLFLLVQPSGARLWRFRYRFRGFEKKLAFGQYPEVSLKEARVKRDIARQQLLDRIDPAEVRRKAELDAILSAATTFNLVADEYIGKMEREGRAKATLVKARWFRNQLDRHIGHRPVSEITPHELLVALRKTEKLKKYETTHRLRSFAGRVFRYAVATARASADPADLLRGALITFKPKHHAAIIDPQGVGELLRAIDGYTGRPETLIALQLAPHVFVRPGELRQAEWSEIDFGAAVWRIPAEKMKMGQPHTVPLSTQSLSLLRELRCIANPGIYLFPSLRSAKRPMSENTLNAALRRLGYGNNEMTSHGFRAMASTLLNESGLWNPDAIERALGHQERNAIRAAYHRGTHLKERFEMAQWWSDYLDGLRAGAVILTPKFGRA
jgi:integrase